MTELFLDIVNMSISAGWLVLAVLALRLILKKAPKWVNVLLWGIVAVRLICPFSIESALSLIPSKETISPEIMMDWTPEISTGIEPLDQVVNPVISTSFAPNPGTSANPLQILIPVAANLWLLGVLILLAYTAISYLSLRLKLRTAVILRDNIFQCETVSSPFVLGILKPKIYLPYSMGGNNLNHVVAHEQAHIKRKDHWWKPLGFLLLTIYWFNPLMWVAYILLCRDIELACDEKVIAELGNEQRADYTHALVACAVNRRMIAACPLAFGEVGVKDRVKSIMNYRKPTFWIIVIALVVCVVVAVCFLTDPFEPVFNDVLHQNGYVILSQNDRELTLTVPKDYLPNEIYTAEGYEFDEGQVVAYSTDTTTIWLRKVMISNESPDQLYFAFDISYDIAEKGTILSINSRLPNDQYTIRGGLRSKDLRDNHTVYPGAVNMRGHGPDSQFWFYVSTDACKQAEGALYLEVVLNEIEYEADRRDRSFSMSGDNVSNLNPEVIVERILDVEDITNSGVYMNSMNFSLQVDSDFNWADSQAVTYFFTKSKTTYKGQLRIFPHEEKYFLTEPSEGQEQQSIFLLQHYLEAIKYLPQYDIQQMAPADQYIIQHREEGTPKDYERVITYTPDGAKEIEGWNIHLQIQPLHQDGDAYSGTGEEVIDVFYSSGYGRTTNPAVKWFDYTEDPSGMSYEQELKIQLDEFPGITFKYTPYDIIATTSWEDSNSVGKSYLISGMPIWNAYFCDLTGDGLPEICSQVSYGSGIIDNRVIIHDYANGASYSLIDRGYHDYYLRMNDADGYLYVDKKVYNSDELVSSGRLVYKDNCLQIEGVITEPVEILAPEQGFEGNLNLGLNAEIVEIDSMNQILYVKDIDDGADVFGDRCAVECNYAISRYNLLYVNYGNPKDVRTIDFSTFEVGDAIIIGMYESEKEKAFNGSAIAEQVQLGTQKFTDENLIKKISNDLDLPTGCSISYIGEYSDGSDALLWFAIDGNYPDQYVAVECEKRSSGKYKFIDTYSPMTYAQDIVHVVWKAEDIFLVNNRDCSQIVYMNEAREVIREIDVAEYGLPYVFRLSMPSNPGICMFVDVTGEEIR